MRGKCQILLPGFFDTVSLARCVHRNEKISALNCLLGFMPITEMPSASSTAYHMATQGDLSISAAIGTKPFAADLFL